VAGKSRNAARVGKKIGKVGKSVGAEMGYPKGIIAFVDMSWQYSYLKSVFGVGLRCFSNIFKNILLSYRFQALAAS